MKEVPSITLPYRLWEHDDHDLTCEDCGQIVRHGQPYVSRLTGVYDNGDTLAELQCVYCGTPGPSVSEVHP